MYIGWWKKQIFHAESDTLSCSCSHRIWPRSSTVVSATVTRIDPGPHEIAETYRLSVGRGQLALAAGEGAAWVSNALDGTVTRIDGATNEVSSIPVSAYSSPRDVTVAGGLVWVTVADDRAAQ